MSDITCCGTAACGQQEVVGPPGGGYQYQQPSPHNWNQQEQFAPSNVPIDDLDLPAQPNSAYPGEPAYNYPQVSIINTVVHQQDELFGNANMPFQRANEQAAEPLTSLLPESLWQKFFPYANANAFPCAGLSARMRSWRFRALPPNTNRGYS